MPRPVTANRAVASARGGATAARGGATAAYLHALARETFARQDAPAAPIPFDPEDPPRTWAAMLLLGLPLARCAALMDCSPRTALFRLHAALRELSRHAFHAGGAVRPSATQWPKEFQQAAARLDAMGEDYLSAAEKNRVLRGLPACHKVCREDERLDGRKHARYEHRPPAPQRAANRKSGDRKSGDRKEAAP